MTVTNSQATAFSNQKKMVVRSNGQMVLVITDTAANGKFLYSTDDGETWNDYGLDIAGWANGSLALYTDTGFERIVAAWKQSGVGGGRIDGHIYVAVGDFFGGFGAAVDITAGSTSWNFVDLVAHAEGTGGQIHVVASYQTGAASIVTYWAIPVGATGVPGVPVQTNISPDYGMSAHTYPSIDINPVTKNLFCAWSAGAAGAGKGIRFRKATYAAGAWTWGTEREIDSTTFVFNQDYSIICRWDALNNLAIIGLPVAYNGAVLVEKVYQRDAADTTTTTLLSDTTTTTYHCNGSMVVAPNGDIYLFGALHAAIGSGQQPLSYRKLTRLTATTVSDGGYVPFTYGDQRWVNALYSANKIRMVYTGGNNPPYQVRYDQLVIA